MGGGSSGCDPEIADLAKRAMRNVDNISPGQIRELAPLANAALNKMGSSQFSGSSSSVGEFENLANNMGGANFGAVSSSNADDDIPSLAKKAMANLEQHRNDPEMQALAKKALDSLGGSLVQRGRFDNTSSFNFAQAQAQTQKVDNGILFAGTVGAFGGLRAQSLNQFSQQATDLARYALDDQSIQNQQNREYDEDISRLRST